METIGVSFDTDSGESRGVLLDLSESGMASTRGGGRAGLDQALAMGASPSGRSLGTECALLRADKESGRFSVEFLDPPGKPSALKPKVLSFG